MSIEEKFWNKVDRRGSDDCWNWTARCRVNGYGQIMVPRASGVMNETAHRVSYQLHNGAIPDGKYVLHSCDNRKCVNPKHLRLGTQSDNLIDALKRGRAPGMKLCELDVEIIRSLGNVTLKQIAEFFDISISQAWNIRSGSQWKHIS